MLPLLLGSLLPRFAVGAQPPHIVFVMADDLGSNDVGRWQGVVGDPSSLTPELDALANSGVVLTDCCETFPGAVAPIPCTGPDPRCVVQTPGAGARLPAGRLCLAVMLPTPDLKAPVVAAAERAAECTCSRRGSHFSPQLSKRRPTTHV